ncbi:MAG: class I SAM-dependent methyltransferase [Rhodobacteraceae bacterium]|nr:class I SAM-dependent methyltransferase [Paracoccaceae bacterium]
MMAGPEPGTGPDPETLAFYEAEASHYADWSAAHGLPRHFRRFAARLSPGAAVLDLGCGGGWAALAFAERGHAVTALDPSAAMLARLDGVAGVRTCLGDIAALDAQTRFGGIWAHFSLQHVPRAAFPVTLARVAGHLAPGGWLFLGLHEGRQTRRDGLGRLYCHHEADAVATALRDLGLGPAALARARSTGYDGTPIAVMYLEAQALG